MFSKIVSSIRTSGMEFVGEVVAEIIGLNTPLYQWVLDSANEEDRRRLRRAEIEANRMDILSGLRDEKAAREADVNEAGSQREEQTNPVVSGE